MSQVLAARYPLAILLLLLGLAGLGWLYFHETPPRTVRVGWYLHPPLIGEDPLTGGPQGFYVSLLEEIGHRENLRFEYVKTTPHALLLEMGRPQGFAMATPITLTHGREERFDFSWPVGQYRRGVLGRATGEGARQAPNYEMRVFGALDGTVHHEMLQTWYGQGLIGGVMAFDSSDALLAGLLSGKVDYLYDDTLVLAALARRYPEALVLQDDKGLQTPPFYRGFPVAKGQEWLLRRINQGLRRMMNDGRFSELFREHFPSEAAAPPDQLSRPDQASLGRNRLPAIELDQNYDARAILDNYFDIISSDAEGVRSPAMIDQVNAIMRDGRQEFNAKLHLGSQRLNELLLLIESQPKDAPYLPAFYYRQVEDLDQSAREVLVSLLAYRQRFDLENIQMENNLKMIQALEITQPDLAWRKDWILKNFAAAIAAQKRWIDQIDWEVRRCEEFLAQVEDLMRAGEKQISKNYREYFFSRFDALDNADNYGGIGFQWQELKGSLISWLLALPTQLRVIAPDPQYLAPLGWLLIPTLLLASPIWVAGRRLGWVTDATPWQPSVLAWSGIYLLLGCLPLPSTNDNLLLSLAMFLLGLASVDYAWRSRHQEQAFTAMNPFLLTLLSIFLIDVLSDLLAPRRVILAVLTLLSPINLLWLIHHIRARKGRELDIHALFFLGVLIWTAAGVAAWLGYLYPALATVIVGGLVMCVFYAGILTTQNLLRLSKGLQGTQSATAGFISTLVIPFVWLALIFGAVQWAAGAFNAAWFIKELYDVDLISAVTIRLRPSTILNLLLMALLLRFALNWVHDMLVAISGARQLDLVSLNSSYLVVRYLAWVLYSIIALASLRIDWDSLKWILGGLSVGFGFAMKDILENFFAGIIILIGKQVRPGDIIEFGSVYGVVRRINIRATFIETDENSLVALPNSQIVTKEFQNWTLNGDIRRHEFKIGVAYGTDLRYAMRILMEVMHASHYVVKHKQPDVLIGDFDSSAIVLRVRFWIHASDRTNSAASLRLAAEEAFRVHGISMPFPQLDVHFDAPPAGGLVPLPGPQPAPAV